jgi:hypothetical protein
MDSILINQFVTNPSPYTPFYDNPHTHNLKFKMSIANMELKSILYLSLFHTHMHAWENTFSGYTKTEHNCLQHSHNMPSALPLTSVHLYDWQLHEAT